MRYGLGTPILAPLLWQAGVLRGQRLYEISDPIRADEMWVLNDRPSLRFVRDAFSMRRSPTIDLVLSRMPEAEPVSPPSSSTASGGSGEPEPGTPAVSAAFACFWTAASCCFHGKSHAASPWEVV